jgi:two-component system CheB/CheR fusion protein
MKNAKKKRPSQSARRGAPVPAAPARPLTIVGVGASAGGLEAFTQLLEALPANPGLALVLVQHLAPKVESALPVLLAPHTPMPVIQVTHGLRIERDHVYVVPPNVQLQINKHSFELTPRPTDRSQHTPIDAFFTSLSSADGRAIAVVLSGSASDGAVGIREVKTAGGITMAQQPATAKYDSMPRAAIATGMVDLVLTPAEIGAQLVTIAAHPYIKRPETIREEIAVDDAQLQRVFALLKPVSGVDFRHYKPPTIRRRLLRRMALHRITDLDAYIALLQTDTVELRGLFNDLLIHVTRFFREPESFEALATEVFPRLAAHRSTEQPIRIWVCGCASGEEAYSLAISLMAFLQQREIDIRVQIFATDVSESAIDHARLGIYPASIADDVPPELLRRFFTRSDGNYRVSKVIRDLCIFARQDLTKDPPFSRLDLVMCRNVLIYMDSTLQKKLIALFHYALNPHGYLVLGQAETVGAQASLFSVMDKKHRIHEKKSVPIALAPVAFQVEQPRAVTRHRHVLETRAGDKGVQGEITRILIDRFAPPAVVVDADLQIVQFRGQTGEFLEPAPGEANLSLLKMAREGLLYGLRTALYAARKSREPVRKSGLQVHVGREWKPVSIEVVPLTIAGRPHFLVAFEAGRAAASARGSAPAAKSRSRRAVKTKGDTVSLLERELAASREYLQSIIQELEAANEELQSANEEILSSNEELQSTNEELDTAKEELQSTNEELNTVNEELHARNEEISRVNSDLMNLLGSAQIAIVIVSSDLRIRRFTPMAEKVLNLIPTDLDRSISHINPNIDVPDLERLIVECMDAVAPIERQVQDRQGNWYSLRIRPYKNLDNKIDGAVLALFDVDQLKRSEQREDLAREFADALLQSTVQPMAVLGGDLAVMQLNPSFARLFSLSSEEIRGRLLADLGGRAWKLDGWHTRGLAVGTIMPPLRIPPDPSGRWRDTLRVSGRIVASPAAAWSTGILVSVSEESTPSRDSHQEKTASS